MQTRPPSDVNAYIAADFIRDRDIVLMAQRGTWLSEPTLTCTAIDDFNRELLGLRFYSEATKRAHFAATAACHRELAATGADLSAYNSTESAADFADLRARRRPQVALRPGGDRILPCRSPRPRHVLCRRPEAAALRCAGITLMTSMIAEGD